MPIDVPEYVSEAARRGLDWHKEGKSGDGVTEQTLREAREMASGSVSEDKVRRMGPWFQRHRPDMDAPKNQPDNEAFPGAGAVAWALWGGPTSGDIMRTADWAEAKVKQLDEATAFLPNTTKSDMSKITPEAEVAELRTVALALTAERDDLRATVEKLTVGAADELAAAKADASAKEAKVNELTASLEAAASEVATLKALIADLEASKVSASKQAADIVASTGTEPAKMEQPTAAPAKSVEEIRAEYAAMAPSAARIAFLNANRSAILFGRIK